MNILFYAPICELTNKATEMVLEKYYSPDNVLLYDMMEKCEFNPKIKNENKYDVKWMHNKKYRSYKDYYSFPPADDILIRDMSIYEAEIYKMMILYFPPLETFDERQRIYYSVLRLCNGIIERNNITLFVMYGPPHQVFDYVIYCLCKRKNIPTIMTWRLPLSVGYSYYYYDLERRMPEIKIEREITIDELKEDFKAHYFQYIKNSNEGIKPYYMSSGAIKDRIRLFKDRVRHYLKYEEYVKNFLIVAHLNRLKNKKNKYIDRNCEKPDYKKKYIYYALHYQPEATTSPSAGVFTNQQLAIQMLSYYVPDDVYIYVKEHPVQRLRGERFASFFSELNELRNVKIMPRDANSNELQKNAIAVATCTGTVAYEAMYKKKPSILFGNSLYNYAPGAFSVKNNQDCKSAVEAILSGIHITDQDILRYVYTIQTISYHAEYAIPFKRIMLQQGVSLDENNLINYNMICDAIDGLGDVDE